jgi:hypothetical protein
VTRVASAPDIGAALKAYSVTVALPQFFKRSIIEASGGAAMARCRDCKFFSPDSDVRRKAGDAYGEFHLEPPQFHQGCGQHEYVFPEVDGRNKDVCCHYVEA